jgi:hypothetical protein
MFEFLISLIHVKSCMYTATDSQSVLLTQHCVGDKTEKNEMDGACSAVG